MFNRIDLEATEKFFAPNPGWSAADFIRVMIKSEDLSFGYSCESYDALWHARNGHNLRLLFCNLDSVLQGHGIAADMPPFVPVEKEILYPKKAKAAAADVPSAIVKPPLS